MVNTGFYNMENLNYENIMNLENSSKPCYPKLPVSTSAEISQRKEQISKAWEIQQNRDRFFREILPQATA